MKALMLAATLFAGTANPYRRGGGGDPARAFTVPNASAAGAAGVTFAFTDASSADALNFTPGIAYLQPGDTFGTNAAGVVVVPGTSGVGQTPPNGSFAYGALIATLNGTTRVQVFATNAANGLGSATPPTALIFGTLSSLFGSSQISGPVSINFTVSDLGYADNSGSFQVASTAVPEPATWAMMLIGLGMVGYGLRRR